MISRHASCQLGFQDYTDRKDHHLRTRGPHRFHKGRGRIVSIKAGESYYCSRNKILDEAFEQLNEYLKGERKTFDLDLEPEGTDFQKDVWNALLDVPYGKTISYSELAKASGHPRAVRAVGGAMHSNPIPIVIPCHRVIRSDGSIGGYALGPDLKTRLLKLEGFL